MKWVRAALKFFGGIFVFILIALTGLYLYFNETEPTGTSGAEADQLARSMMQAVNLEAWDTTHWVSWSFRDDHHYIWNKKEHWVQIDWDNYKVILNTKEVDKGKAFENGKPLGPGKNQEIVQKAWSYFCNDSFWLNPVVKAFDPGTERYVVPLESGKKGLKVKYTTGGVTPGDAFLWILDETHRPEAWKMWVKILPLGGVKTTWEGWTRLSTGALISTVHTGYGRKIEMIKNLKGGVKPADLDIDGNPFSLRH